MIQMRKRLIMLVFLIFNGAYLFGQFGAYKKGLVVLDNGDTLRGYVKDDVQEVNSKKVYFKDLTGSKKMFCACDISSFQREKDSYIKGTVDTINNVPINGLLKVISNGKCKLLKYKPTAPLEGRAKNFGYFPKIYYFILTPQNSLIKVLNKDYQHLIDKYYSDWKVKGKNYRIGNIESDFLKLNSL